MLTKKYFQIFIMLNILVLIFTSGCLSKPQEKPKIKPKTKIGISLAETSSERNKIIKKEIEATSKKEKINVIISDAQKDSLKQKADIEKFITEKVKAVIIQPVDTIKVKDYISMLQEKNIKVILIDALPYDISVDAFIAPDFIRAGELQAQFLLNEGKEQNILILKGDKTNNISEKIYQGNLNILKNSSLTKNFVTQEIPGWDQRKTYELLSTLMSQYKFTGIISHHEEINLGITKFIKETGLEKEIKLTTIGIYKDFASEININNNYSAVDTLPNLVAQFALKVASELVNKDSWEYDLQLTNGMANVPTKIIPVRLITKENTFLIKERIGKMEEQKKESEGNKKENQKSNSNSNQTKLKVKTKDGKELEVVIPGEVQSIEMEPKK